MLLSCKVFPWGATYRGFAVVQQSIEIAESQSENFLFAVIDFSISSSICRSAEFLRGNFFYK